MHYNRRAKEQRGRSRHEGWVDPDFGGHHFGDRRHTATLATPLTERLVHGVLGGRCMRGGVGGLVGLIVVIILVIVVLDLLGVTSVIL